MLTIIQSMFSDLAIFSVMWSLSILTFATSGYLLFSEIESLDELFKVIVVHFELSLGNWVLSIYDEFSLGNTFPVIFHCTSVVINMILMLNLVIAILSETYARLASQRLGLYYDGLIASLPAYQYDPRWGILILVPPPFNIFTVPFILVFLCVHEKKKI